MPEANDQATAAPEGENKTAEEIAAETAAAEALNAGAGDDAGASAPSSEPAATGAAADDDAVDFDKFSVDELRTILETGEIPVKEGEEAAPAVAKTDEEIAAEAKKAEDEAAAAAPAEPFKFTENADDETFAKEEAAFWEQYEKTPEVETLLARRDAKIAELSSKIESNPLLADTDATEIVEAVDGLVNFKLDPETNRHVPDTSKLINLLEKKYPNERMQLIVDLNSQQSVRYPNYTLLQEFMRDTFELDNQKMEQAMYFLTSKGEIPLPSYVPQGIHPSLADAYWARPVKEREALNTQIDQALFTLNNDPDATAEEKATATETMRSIQLSLERDKKGLEADRAARAAEAEAAKKIDREIYLEGEKQFYGTSTNLLSQFTGKLSKSLPMLDTTGSGLTGLSVATLVEKALTDDEYHSKYAQGEMAKLGINFDWKRGRVALDDLWFVEMEIVALQKQGANPRAITIAQSRKNEIVKRLEGLETELSGKIVAKVVSGNAAKVADQMKTAPKTVAVKPKTSGEATTAAATPDYNSMSEEQIRAEIRRLHPAAQALRGDFSGYTP